MDYQSIVPRLPGIVGFASQVEMRGDTEALGVPSAWGESAINSLVSQSDVIVSWAVDWRFGTRPNHLITVHHGSPLDTGGTAAGIPVVSSPVGIASRSVLAITVPIDASPSEWAAAIVSSDRRGRPN